MDKEKLREAAFHINAAAIDQAWEEFHEDIKPFELKRSNKIIEAHKEYNKTIQEINK
jgi:hypothetical protein